MIPSFTFSVEDPIPSNSTCPSITVLSWPFLLAPPNRIRFSSRRQLCRPIVKFPEEWKLGFRVRVLNLAPRKERMRVGGAIFIPFKITGIWGSGKGKSFRPSFPSIPPRAAEGQAKFRPVPPESRVFLPGNTPPAQGPRSYLGVFPTFHDSQQLKDLSSSRKFRDPPPPF